MAHKTAKQSNHEAAKQSLGGPLFDARFFVTAFRERIRSHCAQQGSAVPVILLQLVDGRALDLCHIELLSPRWMMVAAYQDSASCEEMDTVFVPYDTIMRITLSKRGASGRRMGFQLEKSAAALAGT